MATNVKYDFVEHGYGVANMIVDPTDWAVIGAVNKRGIWRVAYGEPPHLSEKELLERLPQKYERLLPGPRPLKYEIVSANPYWAHQRTAATYRDGRVVLCGDAAHVLSQILRVLRSNPPNSQSSYLLSNPIPLSGFPFSLALSIII